jgi:hypothetical protein
MGSVGPDVPLMVTDVRRNATTGAITLTFNSESGKTYTIKRSRNLKDWNELAGDVPAGGATTSYTDSDILASDLVELDETITDQWIEPTVRFNAPGAPVPVLESVISASRPWALAEYQGGLCTLDEFRSSNGHDPIGGERGGSFAAPQLPTYAQGTQVLSIPSPLSLPPGGADADAPFPRSTPSTSPTSRTPRSGPARLLSQS